MVVMPGLWRANKLAASTLLSAVALLGACSSNVESRPFELDCSVADDYDISIIQALEGTGMGTWFAFGDQTPGSVTTVALTPIPEGRCGSTTALVLTSLGHNDWGGGFGEYAMPAAPFNATGYEGVSFWARAPVDHTSLGFLLTVNDRNTDQNARDENGEMICIQPMVTEGGGAYTYNEAGMIVPVGGELPSPRDCGNGFQRVVRVTRDWQLYLLPFSSFQQQPQPNRIPTGLDPSGIHQFMFNIPKDSAIELWIDDLGVYRRRTDQATQPAGDVSTASIEASSIDSSGIDAADIDAADIDADSIEPDGVDIADGDLGAIDTRAE